MTTLVFAHNPTGWADGAPIRGGMSDVHIAPVLAHLDDVETLETNTPLPGDEYLNIYYTHRRTYGLAREKGRCGIFAGHGLADKAWRNVSRVRDFHFVCTSGPAWSHRLTAQGYPPSRILEIGYPKLDPIFAGDVPSAWPERDGRIRVLWAPTHGGGGEKYRHATSPPATAGAKRTTHWRRAEIVDPFPPDQFHVVEALHPRHRPDGQSTLGEYVGADVVIADGGSTIYEAWALGLPVVFPSWITAPAHLRRQAVTFEAEIYRHQIGRHATDPVSLVELVADAAEHGITQHERAYIEPILPTDLRGQSGRLFAAALRLIADGWQPTAHHALTFAHPDGRRVEVPVPSDKARRLRADPRWELI